MNVFEVILLIAAIYVIGIVVSWIALLVGVNKWLLFAVVLACGILAVVLTRAYKARRNKAKPGRS